MLLRSCRMLTLLLADDINRTTNLVRSRAMYLAVADHSTAKIF